MLSKLLNAMIDVKNKEGQGNNPVLFALLSNMSEGLELAHSMLVGEGGDARPVIELFSRNVLSLEPKLRLLVDKSPSQWDNTILDELVEAATEFAPDGYVPVQW